MPITPTYPGVYIEEVSSGVRTITGVSTSVTAFVGEAKRGPINKAVRIRNFGDYERAFGGLAVGSEMSYSVRQFFLNGGSEAFIVRLAKNATRATRTIQNGAAVPIDVLIINALDEGGAGNNIEIRTDYKTTNPASTFNLTVEYVSPDNPATDSLTERFENLSMNSADARYVKNIVNDASTLIRVERAAALTSVVLDALSAGKSESGVIALANTHDATHDQFRVSVNGLPPVKVELVATDVASMAALATAIQTQVSTAVASVPAYNSFTCVHSGSRLVLTSGVAGEKSSVRVLPGERNDIAGRLKLGTLNGGTETDAVAAVRPRELPERGSLESGVFGAGEMAAIAAANTSFDISIDGEGTDTVVLDPTPLAGAAIGDRLAVLAPMIQAKVRALKPAVQGYKDFTVTVSGANKLLLTSGSRGRGSSVVVTAVAANNIAALLHLDAGTVSVTPTNVNLQNGNDEPFAPGDPVYSLFIGSRADRKGIYALEEHFFNILCLPGVTDPGTLMDADSYCQERRAFMVVDAPKELKPDQMAAVAAGANLPKTEYAAVYYPWINVADPLNGGKPRTSAPCGAIAGLYARTDSRRGVWKAPAGMDATLSGVLGTSYVLTDGENGTLNPLGVNCIRQFPVFGNVAWGARTLRGADAMASEYKYVPIRRLALFIEESLYQGTKWVVFEPNDEPLWSQIRLNLGAFMNNLFRQGAFQGRTPREAYFVKCDKETTTQNDINLGIVNIVVGFAPLKPAEFVIIRIQQIAGAIQT